MNVKTGQGESSGMGGGDLESEASATENPVVPGPSRSRRFGIFGFYLLALSVAFASPLLQLFHLAIGSELHSYILLIPFVFAYLVHLRREELRLPSRRSITGAGVLVAIGLTVLAVAFTLPQFSSRGNASDHLALTILGFASFVVAGGFLFLGKEWMRTLAFPFAFLIFLVPLPDQLINWLETASQVASAEAAAFFFAISGTPILREGMIFQLPGMVIEVGQECSGIRSSLVLFITSLVAAHLYLGSPWRRVVLVAFVIPLGILRNGFRILIIGLLCVHYGPQMIDSVIHRQGGPFFFALSLIPLFLLLWWLRRGESKQSGPGLSRESEPSPSKPLP